MSAYADFIAAKHETGAAVPVPLAGKLHEALFPFQRDITSWALRRGRAAIFADTGLGKSLMQLEWARHVSAHGRVLILAPLAVAEQTVAEGKRFGIASRYARSMSDAQAITVTNYEMLSHFDAASFVGIVLDESSILKAFDGKTRTELIETFAQTPWRLACTATPAPNDFTELGNHSEFLGVKARTEMLAEYFVHDGATTQEWRLKGHAQRAFWSWVCSWAALVKRPSDLGYDDAGFALPALEMSDRVLPIDHREVHHLGQLFAAPVLTLGEQRASRRASLERRVAMAASLATHDEPVLVWCELNDESDAVTAAISGAVQVRGADAPETKRERLLGFTDGSIRVLVTKPSIAGFGMNWQHCAHMIFMGASHSYEQTYQAIRRCWRYGQMRPVRVDVIRLETEDAILRNYQRKCDDADRMSVAMMTYARQIQAETISGAKREWSDYQPRCRARIPSWLVSEDACAS